MTPIELDAGGYWGWDRDGELPFVVEMDAIALLTLMESALRGISVYELMTINRPGDLLNYLRIRLVRVQADISNIFGKATLERWSSGDCGEEYLPFIIFDDALQLEGDDTSPEARCWRAFRATSLWTETMLALSVFVADIQRQVREMDDYLVQGEIARLDAHRHRRDYFHAIERHCIVNRALDESQNTGVSLLPVLDELIIRANVESVSCPLTNLEIWRRLVEEQVRRSESAGISPQVAFTLSGPDGGISAPYEDWGGDVHIPYEGACGADLFIKPTWRRVFLEADARGGSLSDIVFSGGSIPEFGYVCHYLLTQEDLGPLRCASRREVGEGWVLYESNGPYERNLRSKS